MSFIYDQRSESRISEHEGIFGLEKEPWYKRLNLDNVSIPLSVMLGIVVGFALPGNPDLSSDYRTLSNIIGWSYFI